MDLDNMIYEIDKRYNKIKDLEDEIISLKRKLIDYQKKHCKYIKNGKCKYERYPTHFNCYECYSYNFFEGDD